MLWNLRDGSLGDFPVAALPNAAQRRASDVESIDFALAAGLVVTQIETGPATGVQYPKVRLFQCRDRTTSVICRIATNHQ
jgi:hypothetical protein